MMWFRVLVTAVLAIALSLAIYAGPLPFALATAGVVIVLAYGWPRLTDSPQPRLTSLMLFLTGMAGLVSVWFSDHITPLVWLAPVAGGALLWTFIQHLARGIDASHAVANVSAQIAGAVIVLCVGTLLAALLVPGDRTIILVGLVSLTAALAAIALPWPALYTTPLALGVAVLAGMATGAVAGEGAAGWLVSGVLGAVLSALVVAVDLLLGQVARSRYQGPEDADEASQGHGASDRLLTKTLTKTRRLGVQLALGAAPVALSGVVIYMAERVVVFG
ncbi:ammonia permease [Sediminivirga luteola]|uniref:Ammonia permease n=1 Tax=Sediminivirga luteola TaxID=1774748 RepID=A0A8J2TY45_9MICO|nr:ammonia permease [Sediminivirga luteola]MCI2267174.1 ammonia permease [Sediminivirga luteola]GGA13879.1 hypothetical protein GCM10011333_15990 [Sediminivirga luteola]